MTLADEYDETLIIYIYDFLLMMIKSRVAADGDVRPSVDQLVCGFGQVHL